MYVCVCKAVTDSQIKSAIDNGVCTRKQIFDCLGVGRNCGKCNRQIKELLDGNRRQQSIMQAASNEPILNAY
ncbi:(2Fe-2S)-binding protein [Methylobacter sp.]|uniref:(2Fe-2S)-binding protein n=1 Tax=Methylobacter sp. TaxID=2051955 RepID=UPI003DA430A1